MLKHRLLGRIGIVIATMALTLGAIGVASAAIVTGNIIPAPTSVANNAPGAENTEIQGFDEAQNVVLTAPLVVDGGSVPAGVVVNSHMLFLNTPVGTPLTSDVKTFTFDGPIVGVMSDSPGLLEAASNSLLGAPGTFYPGAFPARGLEGGDGYVVNGNDITVTMLVTEPGDWIRVVTFVCDTKWKVLTDSGIDAPGIDEAPGLQKCFNPKSAAAANAGKK